MTPGNADRRHWLTQAAGLATGGMGCGFRVSDVGALRVCTRAPVEQANLGFCIQSSNSL